MKFQTESGREAILFFKCKFLICVAFIIMLAIASVPNSLAQNKTEKSKALQNSQFFTISDGLATNCLDKGFTDSKGRLWFNPCEDEARNQRLSFFQFDGTQTYTYELRPDWLEESEPSPIWYKFDETPSGYFYGSDIDHKIIFCWIPDTENNAFFKLNEGEVLLNMVSSQKDEIYILSIYGITPEDSNKGNYRIRKFVKDKSEVLGSIELNFEGDVIPHEPDRFHYPLEVINNQLVWFHQRKGLVSFDLNRNTAEFTSWQDFDLPIPIKKYYFDYPITTNIYGHRNPSLEWKISKVSENKALLFLGMHNGFFALDPSNNQLKPWEDLNEQFIQGEKINGLTLNREEPTEIYGGELLRIFTTRDKSGNLFLASAYHDPWGNKTDEELRGILFDSAGNWKNWNQELSEIRRNSKFDLYFPGVFFSGNFNQYIASTTFSSGFSIHNISQNLGIKHKSIWRLYTFSHLIQMSDSTLLVNNNIQVRKLRKADNFWDSQWYRLTNWWQLSPRENSSVVSHDNRFWVSTEYHETPQVGLQWYDPEKVETGIISTDIQFEKFEFLDDHKVLLIEDDPSQEKEGDVYIFDLETGKSSPYMAGGEHLRLGVKANDLKKEENGIVWIAVQNGLWRVNYEKGLADKFDHIDLLRNENIQTFHKDPNELLWMGTASKGLIALNKETEEIIQISETDGLADNSVKSIVCDSDHNHWVATANGLSVIDPSNRVLFNLDETEGFLSNWFSLHSSGKLSDGTLVFGTEGGLNFLDPKHVIQILSLKEAKGIYLTEAEFFDSDKDEVNIIKGLSPINEPIVLEAEKRYLKLDFALSDYVGLKGQSFSYRLLPDNTEVKGDINWTNLGSTSKLELSNIAPGDYIVQIKGNDANGNPVKAALSIPIQVEDYFYKQSWFLLSILAIVLLAAWFWINRIKVENIRLETEVEKRTAKIRQDKKLIEKQAKLLGELDVMKSRFFTNISHEFRTPLTVILGVNEQEMEPEKKTGLIRRNANILHGLINQILDLRKLEFGHQTSHMIQGDIVAYLHYITESFESLALSKEINLTMSSSHDSLVLDYDHEKILIMVSNLLTNAIKFSDKGDEVKLEVTADLEGQKYQLFFKDDGIGIPKEKLEHIFDRYYTVEGKQNRIGTGTGVGLTLVKELVKVLEGTIEVESLESEGTTFTITLPISNKAPIADLVPDKSLLPPAYESAIAPIEEDESKELPKVLIVEDNPDVAEYLFASLEKEYSLIYAKDGKEGSEKALEVVPDLIISDVMMPEMDGYELCNKLKTDLATSHIPIILLTAKADQDSRIEGINRGADAYLAKPFDERELKAQLKNLYLQRERLHRRYTTVLNLEPSENEELKQEDVFLIRVREVILEHMDEEEFGVPELCKGVNLSRTQVHNKIKSLTNKSTSQFIKKVRMEKAKELFHSTDLNVTQISLEVGIPSLAYFSRLFREENGLSPQEYLKKVQIEQ